LFKQAHPGKPFFKTAYYGFGFFAACLSTKNLELFTAFLMFFILLLFDIFPMKAPP